MTLQEQRRIARQMIALYGKPYDPETSDDDNRAFEALAIKLAYGVVLRETRRDAHDPADRVRER